MFHLLDRLRHGERWWPAELALRGLGLALLAACIELARVARLMAAATPDQARTSPAEFAVCVATVLALWGGLALLLFGTGLLRREPIPRSAWKWEER